MKNTFPFNKVCNLEDFQTESIAEIIRAIYAHDQRSYLPDFPVGSEKLGYWEAAMSMYTLEQHGLLNQQSSILVLGYGFDPISFYLTNHAHQVFVADIFLSKDCWNKIYPRMMLLAPEEYAPYPCHTERLIVQHFDRANPRLPYQAFDAIVACNIVENSPDLDSVASFVATLSKFLKPQGILVFNAKYQLIAPPGVRFATGFYIPKLDDLQRCLATIHGMELIGDFHSEVSAKTLECNRDVTTFAEVNLGKQFSSKLIVNNQYDWSNEQRLVHTHAGIAFSSVHVAMRKVNASEKLESDVSFSSKRPVSAEMQAMLLAEPSTQKPSSVLPVARLDNMSMEVDHDRIYNLQQLYYAWEAVRLKAWYNKYLQRLPQPVSGLIRFGVRLAMLGRANTAQAQLSQALIDYCKDVETSLSQLHISTSQQSAHLGESISRQQVALNELQQQLKSSLNSYERLNQDYTNNVHQIQTTLEAWQQQIIFLQESLATLQQQVQQYDQEVQQYEQQVQQYEQQVQQQAQQIQVYEQRSQDSESRWQASLGNWQQQVSSLEKQLQNTTGQLRYLHYMQAMQASSSEKRSSPVSGDDLVRVISELEDAEIGLEKCQAIEVSLQDAKAEPAIRAISVYFGERLSSHGSTYNYPNDAWIHVNLNDTWIQPNLIVDASSRLANQGLLIVIIAADNAERIDDERFILIHDQAITLRDEQNWRVVVWTFVQEEKAS